MMIKDMQVYESYHNKNKDAYGSTILDFAEKWAELLEQYIKDEPADSVEDNIGKHAEKACDETDKGFGISGFAYGCAVSFLSDAWMYGDILRAWHNKKYSYMGSGVANPACLVVET